MEKDTIIKYFQIIMIMFVLPIICFFAINYFFPLDAILYATASLTGFYAICIITAIKILYKDRSVKGVVSFLFLMLIFPVVAYYIFKQFVPLNVIIFASIGFGAFVGVCIDLGFRIILSKEKWYIWINISR